tara:strand:- start:608 stop:802 length:195 start_codon:yes stop_codon:yes gene_type:complete
MNSSDGYCYYKKELYRYAYGDTYEYWRSREGEFEYMSTTGWKRSDDFHYLVSISYDEFLLESIK